MRLSPTAVLVFGLISLAGVLGGGYMLGIHSRTVAESRGASLRTQIASCERESRTNQSRAMELRSQIDWIERSAETGPTLRNPGARNSVLADIAKVASDHGLQIDELTAGVPVTPGEASQEGSDDLILSTPITLRAHGRISEALRAIAVIHRTMPGVEIRTLALTGDPISNGPGTVSIGFLWYADRSD